MRDVDSADVLLADSGNFAEKLILAELVVGVRVVQANHSFVRKVNEPFLPLNILVSDQAPQHLGQAASTQRQNEAAMVGDSLALRLLNESSKVLDKRVRIRERVENG